jgi:hypothetical protein
MKKYAFVLILAVVAIGAVLVFKGRSPERTPPPIGQEGASSAHGSGGAGNLPAGHPQIGAGELDSEALDFSGIEVPSGGKNIATLYAERKSLEGKKVVIRGKVVKFTPDVMKKNWIHVRDGTGAQGTNDVTVTTDAVVKVGDVVLARGVLHTDKDFGFGYTYEIIIEDAEVTVE